MQFHGLRFCRRNAAMAPNQASQCAADQPDGPWPSPSRKSVSSRGDDARSANVLIWANGQSVSACVNQIS